VFNLESATPAIRVAAGRNFMDGVAEPRDPLNYDRFIEFPGHGTRTWGRCAATCPTSMSACARVCR